MNNQMTLTVSSHITHRFDLSTTIIDEIDYTKQCLNNAFKQQKQSLIYIEQYNSERSTHYTIDICPVDAIELNDIRLCYIQEMTMLDPDQQNSRTCIDLLKTQKTVAQALHNAQVSYYMIQFDVNSNDVLLHILDPSEQYDDVFGLRVLCDQLGESSELLLRNKTVARDIAIANVKSIKQIYTDKYDWTHKLKSNKK